MDALYSSMVASKTRRSEFARLLQWSAVAVVALPWLVALILSLRRVSGAVGESPDRISLWLVAVLMVLMSAGARWLWQASRDADRDSYARVVVDWGCLPAMVIAGWAVALPGTTVASLAGYIAIVVVAETWALRGYVTTFRSSSPTPRTVSNVVSQPQPVGRISGEDIPEVDPNDRIRVDPPQTPAPHFPAADIAQQLIRRVDGEGNEQVEGWVRAVFASGQRTSSTHVAFCPTLEGELSIEFAHANGPEARVKAAQVLPYGVRFDVKLADTAEQHETVLVQFVAKGQLAAAATTE